MKLNAMHDHGIIIICGKSDEDTPVSGMIVEQFDRFHDAFHCRDPSAESMVVILRENDMSG